jgi:hypothetical protein
MNGVDLKNNFFEQSDLESLNNMFELMVETKQKVDPRMSDSSTFDKNFKDFYLDRNLGRIRMNLEPKDLPENILNTLNTKAKEIDPRAELGLISFVRYQRKYGHVQLIPHFDKPSHVAFLFDIQINANTVWHLVVAEHGEYGMENNDVLILDATRKIHWRKPQVFEDGQFVDMLFVTYENKNIEMACIDNQEADVKPYYDAYKEYADSIYPPSMHKCYMRILKMW